MEVVGYPDKSHFYERFKKNQEERNWLKNSLQWLKFSITNSHQLKKKKLMKICHLNCKKNIWSCPNYYRLFKSRRKGDKEERKEWSERKTWERRE